MTDAPRPLYGDAGLEQVKRHLSWFHAPGRLTDGLSPAEAGMLLAYADRLAALAVDRPPAGEAAGTEEARKAAATVLQGFDDGIFVRDTSDDFSQGWHWKIAPYVAAIATLGKWARGTPEAPGEAADTERLDVAQELLASVRDSEPRLLIYECPAAYRKITDLRALLDAVIAQRKGNQK